MARRQTYTEALIRNEEQLKFIAEKLEEIKKAQADHTARIIKLETWRTVIAAVGCFIVGVATFIGWQDIKRVFFGD